jgi:hypothetical protein
VSISATFNLAQNFDGVVYGQNLGGRPGEAAGDQGAIDLAAGHLPTLPQCQLLNGAPTKHLRLYVFGVSAKRVKAGLAPIAGK